MDLEAILNDMRREHAHLGEAILSLERLGAGTARRGRPPAWVKAAQSAEGPAPAARGKGDSAAPLAAPGGSRRGRF